MRSVVESICLQHRGVTMGVKILEVKTGGVIMQYDGLRAGQEIRRLRTAKRMSIMEMSSHLETSASHLNQVEFGKQEDEY